MGDYKLLETYYEGNVPMFIGEGDIKEIEEYCIKKKRSVNRAIRLIDDALDRYRKEKTRAKSRKATRDKETALASPRYKCLEDYDRYEDIAEYYGCGGITSSERDRLEELWEEREEIRNKAVDGIYEDEVTKLLKKAIDAIYDSEENTIALELDLEAKALMEERKRGK